MRALLNFVYFLMGDPKSYQTALVIQNCVESYASSV